MSKHRQRSNSSSHDPSPVQAQPIVGKQTQVAARYSSVQRRAVPSGSAPVQMSLVPIGGQLRHEGGTDYFIQTVERLNNQVVDQATDLSLEQATLIRNAIREGRLTRGDLTP